MGKGRVTTKKVNIHTDQLVTVSVHSYAFLKVNPALSSDGKNTSDFCQEYKSVSDFHVLSGLQTLNQQPCDPLTPFPMYLLGTKKQLIRILNNLLE